jgi:hypothetical protein
MASLSQVHSSNGRWSWKIRQFTLSLKDEGFLRRGSRWLARAKSARRLTPIGNLQIAADESTPQTPNSSLLNPAGGRCRSQMRHVREAMLSSDLGLFLYFLLKVARDCRALASGLLGSHVTQTYRALLTLQIRCAANRDLDSWRSLRPYYWAVVS